MFNGTKIIKMPKYTIYYELYLISIILRYRYYPLSQKVSVGNGPVSGVTFSQLKGKLSGRVQCKLAAACADIPVTLRPLSADGGYVGQPMTTVAKGELFMFDGNQTLICFVTYSRNFQSSLTELLEYNNNNSFCQRIRLRFRIIKKITITQVRS